MHAHTHTLTHFFNIKINRLSTITHTHGVSHCCRRISSSVAGTTTTVTSLLSCSLDCACYPSLPLCLNGTNTYGLEIVNGVLETRSPRCSGMRSTVEFVRWYATHLKILTRAIVVTLRPISYWKFSF